MMTRFQQYPEEAAKGVFMEYVSMALNHRQTLYPKEKTLLAAVTAMGMDNVLESFQNKLEESEWGLYWIRRIYYAPAHAYRSVRILETGSWNEMQNELLPTYGDVTTEGGVPRVISIQRTPGEYPVLEEMMVAAPRTVEPKDTFKHYDEKWEMALEGDWEFLAEKYRPDTDDDDEVEHEGRELGRSLVPASEIPAVIEDDSRKDEEKFLCENADILETPYLPECPS